jgi:hypothetical protein
LTTVWQAPQVEVMTEVAPPLGEALGMAKRYQVMALKALVEKIEQLEQS